MLTLIRAGLYTSVQDGGREGLRQSGISRCGALDYPSLVIANLLVGNEANAAGLEITLGQVEIEFARSGWFALTGAACEATLDGKAVWVGWRTAYRAGQRLVLKTPQHGIRSYLAVAGGVAVPVVLGSRSTDLKAGIGGLEGRRLQDGDQLKLGKAARRFTTSRGVKQLPLGNRIRALPGPEYHEFDAASQASFWRSLAAQSAEQSHGLPPAGAAVETDHRSRDAVARSAAGRSAGAA